MGWPAPVSGAVVGIGGVGWPAPVSGAVVGIGGVGWPAPVSGVAATVGVGGGVGWPAPVLGVAATVGVGLAGVAVAGGGVNATRAAGVAPSDPAQAAHSRQSGSAA